MQQYKSSRNSQLLAPRADMSQDSLWVGLALVFVVAFLVRIMVSLCELFLVFCWVFWLILGDYLHIFSSHNGRRGFANGC